MESDSRRPRRCFFDEFALAAQGRIVDGEPRWQTIGMVEGILV
jgi:uncharacterized DUF497 family protein